LQGKLRTKRGREGGREGGKGKRDGKRDGFGCGKREIQRQAHGTPPFLDARRDGYVVSSLVFFFGVGSSFLASSSEVEEGLLCTGRPGDNWVVAICTYRISGGSGS
jgi:hypothetical protein